MSDVLKEMRRNLLLGLGPNGMVYATALQYAAQLAACSMAEDIRAIRELLERPAVNKDGDE